MRTDGVMNILGRYANEFEGASTRLGRKDDAAFIRVLDLRGDNYWVVISSPGDRWFSLDFPGGYSLDHFEEETLDQDVERILEDYVRIAQAYFRDRPLPTPVGRLGRSALAVETEAGPVVMHKSLFSELRDCFQWRRA